MRYLTQRSSGIWYFRYQIPPKYRPQFLGRIELKRSLHTKCRVTAKLRASKIQQKLWQELLLLECQSNKNTSNSSVSELLPKFFELEERNVWGFSDGEKNKIIEVLSNCLSTLESQPQLLRAQQRRIALRNEGSNEWIESIELIEGIWDRSKSSVEHANSYVSELPWAKNAERSYYYEEIVNVAITLCKFVESFQKCLDVLDVPKARTILDELHRYEWVDLQELSKPLIACDYYQESVSITDTMAFQVNTNGSSVLSKPAPDFSDNSHMLEVANPVNAVNIEDILEGYRLEKDNLNRGKKEIKAVVTACRLVHDLLGSSDMANVSRDDVNRIIPLLKQFPANARSLANKKHFDGLSATQIIEKNKDVGGALRKEEQAMRDIERASSVYRWAIEHNKITYNPFNGLSKSKSKSKAKRTVDAIDDDKSKKEPFTAGDLRKIFSHPVYTQLRIGINTRDKIRLNYQYWVMLIALTTGARPNEICQLRLRDVQFREGILCFLVQEAESDQSVKNANAVRIIPVPDVLFRLGFQSYLDSVKGEGLLFPDLTYTEKSGFYGKVEDWFTRTFSMPMGLSSQNKSFYSFRHSFIFDYQKRGKRCPIVAQLVGHENGCITDDTYGGRFSVKKLKEKIDELNVDDILKNVLSYKV